MTAPKRMALAFGCMLLAIAIFGTMDIVHIAIFYGPRHALPNLQMLPVYLLFAFPGWVLALPFVSCSKTQMVGVLGPSWPLEQPSAPPPC
jgi:hypothetical protein